MVPGRLVWRPGCFTSLSVRLPPYPSHHPIFRTPPSSIARAAASSAARATRTCSPSIFRRAWQVTHCTCGLAARRLNVSFIWPPQPGHSIVSTAPPNRSGMLPLFDARQGRLRSLRRAAESGGSRKSWPLRRRWRGPIAGGSRSGREPAVDSPADLGRGRHGEQRTDDPAKRQRSRDGAAGVPSGKCSAVGGHRMHLSEAAPASQVR